MEALSKKQDVSKDEYNLSFSSTELEEIKSLVNSNKSFIALCKIVIRILDDAKNRGEL